MDSLWCTIMWKQFGASIAMLDNAIAACPDNLWRQPVWPAPSATSQFSEFWHVAYHVLFWLDLQLFGAHEGFTPPAPFEFVERDGVVLPRPTRIYSKEELRAYLESLRQKCRVTLTTLTDERARQPVNFPWMREGEVVTYAELQLYTMRHTQEHTAQLSLLLGQHGVSDEAVDWETRAEEDLSN